MKKKDSTKEQAILKAAIKEFAGRGFYQAKISHIADAAGVATGSIYLYFENKEQILHQIFLRLWKSLLTENQNLMNRTDLTASEKLEKLLDIIFDKFAGNSDLAVVFVNAHDYFIRTADPDFLDCYRQFLALGEDLIRNGIREGEFNSRSVPRIASNFIFGGIRHLLHQWAQDTDEFPLSQIRAEIKLLIKQGLLIKK